MRRFPGTSVGFEALALVLMAGGAGCGESSGKPEGIQSHSAALTLENSLIPNGLGDNGLNGNGLNGNGLSGNGLNGNGLNGNGAFADWFNSPNFVVQEKVTRYLIQCALPDSSVVTWTNPADGVEHTWPGAIGLAPNWEFGSASI